MFPSSKPAHQGKRWFSPRARGCSGKFTVTVARLLVFPACAGMFRVRYFGHVQQERFPRVRGDVPIQAIASEAKTPFSPRARGCSEFAKALGVSHDVFPACAGMFLMVFAFQAALWSFPRVRGDVPYLNLVVKPEKMFSPRARGCSGIESPRAGAQYVFPACAGMFLRPDPRL